MAPKKANKKTSAKKTVPKKRSSKRNEPSKRVEKKTTISHGSTPEVRESVKRGAPVSVPKKAGAPSGKKAREQAKEELRLKFVKELEDLDNAGGGKSESEGEEPLDEEAGVEEVDGEATAGELEDAKAAAEAAMAEVLAENDRLQKKAESRARKPKLEKPGDFDGGKGKYRAWVRTIQVWKNVHEDVSDRVLGAMLLQSLSGKALDAATGSLGDDELSSFESLMGVLEEFGADDVIEALGAEAEFQSFTRNGQDLNEFITMYDALKKKAMRHGLRESEITAGSNLLKKAEVPAAMRASIISQITAANTTMSYAEVKRQLKANATASELVAEGETLKKNEKKALLARGFADGKAKGKGKGFGTSTAGGKGQQSSGDGQKNKVCWFEQQGKCLKGVNCPFKHQAASTHQALKGKKGKDGKGKGKGKGVGKGSLEWREGDWECPNASCKDHQFAANEKCRKCGTAKPTH